MLRLPFKNGRDVQGTKYIDVYVSKQCVWIIGVMPDVDIATWMRFTPVGL